MNTLNDLDHLDPSNPMYYAPRRIRDEAKSQLPESDDTKPEFLNRSPSSPSSFDALLKEALGKSRRHPLDPETVHQPAGLNQWRELVPIVGRFAVAVGVAALVALFFVVMVPALRDQAQDGGGSTVTESLKAAFTRQPSRESEARPALAEAPAVVAANRTAQPAEPATTHEQSEALLQQFLQWEQKLGSTEAQSQ